MHNLILLTLACCLLACSDGKTSSTGGKTDAGDENTSDAGTEPEDDGGEVKASQLERAPGSLPRPTKRLPDDLKPPGFAK